MFSGFRTRNQQICGVREVFIKFNFMNVTISNNNRHYASQIHFVVFYKIIPWLMFRLSNKDSYAQCHRGQ